MNLLDPIPEPYEPPHARTIRIRKAQIDENLESLNNAGHALIAEDFSDSPFADREPLEEETEDDPLRLNKIC